MRLFISAGRPAETFETLAALAERIIDLARHPNTQAARDVALRYGMISTTGPAGTLPCLVVKVLRDQAADTLGYAVFDDPPAEIDPDAADFVDRPPASLQARHRELMAALVAAAFPTHVRPRRAA